MEEFRLRTEVRTDDIYEARAENREVVIDAGSGEHRGQTPMELVLSALSGCAVVDVIQILKKRRKQIDDLSVDVVAKRRDEPYPRIFTEIHMRFLITSPDVNQTELDKAISLSLETYCSVRGMIHDAVTVTADGVITRP